MRPGRKSVGSGARIGISALLLCLGSAPALAADADPVAAKAKAKNSPCAYFGKEFTYYEELNMCADFSGQLYTYVGMDFAHDDIEMHGVRLPVAGDPNPRLPMLFYHEKDVSEDTKHVEIGGGVTANFKLGWDTDKGPVLGFVQLGAYSDGRLSGAWGDMFDSQNIYNEGDWYFYPGGFVRQAWLKYDNWMVGIQPSKFDLVSSGYSAFPGYATRDTVASIAYTFRQKDTSLSIALEDATHRYRDDGVLASYEEGHHRPDLVVLGRHRHKNMLLHGSFALHSIDDRMAEECCGVDADDRLGWAASVGAEWRFGWRNDPKDPLDDRYAKFMIAGAATEGATGYLGIPFFATDYVATPDGSLDLTRGVSGVASYEYIWSRQFKTSITGSGFWVEQESSSEIMPGVDLGFDVEVYGAKLQLGAEWLARSDLVVGAEFAYNWTWAQGEYNGVDANTVEVGYPEVKAYMAYRF